jgi:hypothetical protein
MNDPGLVRSRKPLGHLYRAIERLVHTERPRLEQPVERRPVHMFHDDEVALDAVGHVAIDVVDRHDAGMVERGSRLGLAYEALPALRRRDRVRPEHFDGDGSPESGVAGAIQHAHPAAAEFLEYLVVGDRPSSHWSTSPATRPGQTWPYSTATRGWPVCGCRAPPGRHPLLSSVF